MLATPDIIGPNHGTTIVILENIQYIVDGSMQTELPTPIQEGEFPGKGRPASKTRFEINEGLWHLLWNPPNRIEGPWCRLEKLDVSTPDFICYCRRCDTPKASDIQFVKKVILFINNL